MAYANYNYYVTEFFGEKVGADEFPRLAKRASDYIDYITSDRARYYKDERHKLADCCCALVDVIASHDTTELNGTVSSESVGGHSVTYRNASDVEADLRNRMKTEAASYLGTTGLLYRGIPVCTHHMY